MEGVTILNTTPVTGLPVWVIIICVIACVAFVVFDAMIITDDIVVFKRKTRKILIVIFTILAIAAPTLFGYLNEVYETGHYYYECVIEDTASFNEIMDTYEIVDQRGDIWVLKDK